MKADEQKRFRIHLRTKFSAASILLALILSIALTLASYFSYKNAMEARYIDTISGLVRTAAGLIDGDRVDMYLDSGAGDEAYTRLQQQFLLMQEQNELMYLYCYKATPQGFHVLVQGTRPGDEGHFDLGEWSNDPDYYTQADFDSAVDLQNGIDRDGRFEQNGTTYISVFDTGYGYSVTAFERVYNSAGEPVALVGADMSMEQINTELHGYLLLVAALALAIIVVFTALYLFWLTRKIINPLQVLVDSAVDFVDTGYDEREGLTSMSVEVGTGDEIEDLANAFNKMTEDIVSYITELTTATSERERVETELRVATLIQEGMLPRDFEITKGRGLELFANMRAAKSVGGDFYDFFFVDKTHICVVVGDVSDKGVPAALFMAMAKATVKDLVLQDKPIDQVLFEANNSLCKNNDQGMFVTMYVAILDLETGLLTWVDAGHSPAMLWRASDGAVSELHGAKGFAAGALESMEYTMCSARLQPGDILFAYTDGVSEAIDPREELYGEARIQQFIAALPERDVEKLCTGLVADIDRYAQGGPQFDDITVLALKFTGRLPEKRGDA
jgi:sigma-B regulation protein RsbU (phosphoserine phosphatase)